MDQRQNAESAWQEITTLALIPVLVGALTLVSWALEHWGVGPYFLSAGLAVIATLLGGAQRFISGFRDIYQRKITVNVFVVVALVASIGAGEFRPAAIIVFIMAIAGALESYTLDKTFRSIRDLLDLTPKTASVRREQGEVIVPINEVLVDDVVVVRPGERIPVDGVVVAGNSSVNQAPITGESIAVEKSVGHDVYNGTLNESGYLEIRTSKVGDATTLARIVQLVEEAQRSKANIQTVADRFTTWFLPLVLLLAFIGYFTSKDLHVAVSILLVACPCAFAIATPTAVTAGVSNLARRAILVKGGSFLELGDKIDTLLVDKTGTFTLGRPQVVEIVAADGGTEHDVLRLAAIGEKYSNHPLARAVLTLAKERNVDVPDPEDFKVEIGKGIIATWAGVQIIIGKEEFLREQDIAVPEQVAQHIPQHLAKGCTTILIASAGKVNGLIAIADKIRPGTIRAVARLKKLGIANITMLTGDNAVVAGAVAAELGLDGFKADLLPEQKLDFVKQLQEAGHVVGMVGDGINDAPALALADVGIAMGAAGTDVAIETADVTLMNDDIDQVASFVWMSRKVMQRIKLNIFFSIIYNAMGLVLALMGMLTPVLAVILQEAGCVSVVFSSVLLLWAKPKAAGQSVNASNTGCCAR